MFNFWKGFDMKGIRDYLGHGMIWSFILINVAIISNFVAELIRDKITTDNLQIAILYILTGITAYVGYKYVLPKKNKSLPKTTLR